MTTDRILALWAIRGLFSRPRGASPGDGALLISAAMISKIQHIGEASKSYKVNAGKARVVVLELQDTKKSVLCPERAGSVLLLVTTGPPNRKTSSSGFCSSLCCED